MKRLTEAKTLSAESIEKLDEKTIKFIKDKTDEFDKAVIAAFGGVDCGMHSHGEVEGGLTDGGMRAHASNVTRIDDKYYRTVNYEVIVGEIETTKA